jgi:GxxExxY protein
MFGKGISAEMVVSSARRLHPELEREGMPIGVLSALEDLTQQEFDTVDRAVMRCAYSVQNKFGRLFDERIYENEMARRLREGGFRVQTQVPVRVSHNSFEKRYFLDLVVNGMVYELKSVATLVPEHHAQALNYAMLVDIRRVKLINFRPSRVVGELIFNPVTKPSRCCATYVTDSFTPKTSGCEQLLQHVKDLVRDWGTHLSCRLYNEALVHFFGGEMRCVERVDVGDAQEYLGTHLVQSHAVGYSFVVTGLTIRIREYQMHLQRLLNHMDLFGIQWINFNRSEVTFTTLLNEFRSAARGQR